MTKHVGAALRPMLALAAAVALSGCAGQRVNATDPARLWVNPDVEYIAFEFDAEDAPLGLGFLCPVGRGDTVQVYRDGCAGAAHFGSVEYGLGRKVFARDRYRLRDGRVMGLYQISNNGVTRRKRASRLYGDVVLTGRHRRPGEYVLEDAQMVRLTLRKGVIAYGGRVDENGEVVPGDVAAFAKSLEGTLPNAAARLDRSAMRLSAVSCEMRSGAARCRLDDPAPAAPASQIASQIARQTASQTAMAGDPAQPPALALAQASLEPERASRKRKRQRRLLRRR